jgi:hypothetical protein
MGKTRQTGDITSDNNISVDITSDKIGIGTTTPSAKLSIIGDLFVSGISTLSSGFEVDNTGNVASVGTIKLNETSIANAKSSSKVIIDSTGIITALSLVGSGLNISGVSTTGNIIADNITAGIVTASSGIDAIGIQSGGVNIFTGIITALNFVGAGNTFNVDGNTVDISISGTGGGSGGGSGTGELDITSCLFI